MAWGAGAGVPMRLGRSKERQSMPAVRPGAASCRPECLGKEAALYGAPPLILGPPLALPLNWGMPPAASCTRGASSRGSQRSKLPGLLASLPLPLGRGLPLLRLGALPFFPGDATCGHPAGLAALRWPAAPCRGAGARWEVSSWVVGSSLEVVAWSVYLVTSNL